MTADELRAPKSGTHRGGSGDQGGIEQMTEGIESCPFCGSTDTQVDSWVVEQGRPAGSHHEYAVVCQARDCGAIGPKSMSESGAVIRWNARHSELGKDEQ